METKKLPIFTKDPAKPECQMNIPQANWHLDNRVFGIYLRLEILENPF